MMGQPAIVWHRTEGLQGRLSRRCPECASIKGESGFSAWRVFRLLPDTVKKSGTLVGKLPQDEGKDSHMGRRSDSRVDSTTGCFSRR